MEISDLPIKVQQLSLDNYLKIIQASLNSTHEVYNKYTVFSSFILENTLSMI